MGNTTGSTMKRDLIIIGGGPGGLSAGIYAVRNGLTTLILEKGGAGGLVAEAPWIENYLGLGGMKGMEMAEKFKGHAAEYVDIREAEEVESIVKGEGFRVRTTKNDYRCKAVILCTGTEHSKLGVRGEERLSGKGVSYCATCDGFFFRGKRVLVVGGGNSAAMDAVHLHDIGCNVALIHRRKELRAECALTDAIEDRGIEIFWETILEEIRGEDKVECAVLRNVSTEELRREKVEGVFISVGERPNTGLAEELGVELDDKGYVICDRFQRTSVQGVYAAGDITGGVKQIIVACGEGATAALAAFEDLIDPYWSTCRVDRGKG